MSASTSSNDGSSSNSSQPTNPPPPPHRTAIYFHSFPSIKILKPPKGRYSPKVDERCFTYCSQSIRGRIDQQEPWCRSFCIRRVFDHEVRRTLAVHDHDPTHVPEGAIADAKYPLPPEGQPAPETQHTQPQSSEGEEWDEAYQWSPSVSSNRSGRQDTQHWKAGWYLWVSKSRWAAQEKMDLMMCDLARQAEWQKYKDKVNAEWAEYQRQTSSIGELAQDDIGTAGLPNMQPPPVQTQASQAVQGAVVAPPVSPADMSLPPQPGPPFPDIVGQSILLPVPPPLTAIEVPVRNLFAPTQKLLSLAQQSVVSGQQRQLVEKLWEKAQTDEPFKLARNAVMKVWEAFKENADSKNNDTQGPDRNS